MRSKHWSIKGSRKGLTIWGTDIKKIGEEAPIPEAVRPMWARVLVRILVLAVAIYVFGVVVTYIGGRW